MTERLSADRAVRLLRAKVSELEADAGDRLRRHDGTEIGYLAADIALIAGLLADHIEACSAVEVP